MPARDRFRSIVQNNESIAMTDILGSRPQSESQSQSEVDENNAL